MHYSDSPVETRSKVPSASTISEVEVFTYIYDNNVWRGGSGRGSNPENAVSYLMLLRGLLTDDSIQTIVDLGCGDWRLMRTINIHESKTYKGFDLVKSVIEENKAKYSRSNVQFFQIESINNFTEEKGDLLLIKDVMQHWPNDQVEFLIRKILPNFRYALITNGYVEGMANFDIVQGGCRPLNLGTAPFQSATSDFTVLMDYPAHGTIKRVYLYVNPNE